LLEGQYGDRGVCHRSWLSRCGMLRPSSSCLIPVTACGRSRRPMKLNPAIEFGATQTDTGVARQFSPGRSPPDNSGCRMVKGFFVILIRARMRIKAAPVHATKDSKVAAQYRNAVRHKSK
jgi:hypothetical protein